MTVARSQVPSLWRNPLAIIRRPITNSMSAGYREFLPAALEIIESPPAPLGAFSLWCITLIFAAAAAWAWFAHLDIYAVAPGRIQPSGRSKVVQPLDIGKLSRLYVQNGTHVTAGGLLAELDSTEVAADENEKSETLESLSAEVIRRTTALLHVRSADLALELNFPEWVGRDVQARAQASFDADMNQLSSDIATIKAEIREKQATVDRLQLSLGSRRRLLTTLQDRVDMKDALIAKGAGTKSSRLDALQSLQSEETNYAYDQGALAEASSAIETLGKKLAQTLSQFSADQSAKLDDATRKLALARQDLVKAKEKLSRTRLTAPIDGTVQQLALTTIGQVVASGQALMVIVPTDASIEIEADIQNRDIGFVHPGQDATVKIESFPFTRYGTVRAHVVRVSNDAVDSHTASGSQDALAIASGRAASPVNGVSQTDSLVYPVTLALDQPSIEVDGAKVPLGPGMTVSVEIRTGDRRVLDYLFAPLREVGSGAGHER